MMKKAVSGSSCPIQVTESLTSCSNSCIILLQLASSYELYAGKILGKLGRVQFELQKLLDSYVSL